MFLDVQASRPKAVATVSLRFTNSRATRDRFLWRPFPSFPGRELFKIFRVSFLSAASAFVVLALSGLLAPTTAHAQIVGKSCGADTGWSQTAANSGTNMSCINNVWQFPAYQFGAAWATCGSATAGMVQWTGSALQYCDSTSWATLGNSSGVGSAAGSTGDVQYNSSGSLAGSNNLFWNNSSGYLGIGTATPQSALQIYAGELQAGSSGASCSSANAGAIRYANSRLRYCNGTNWVFVN